MTWGLDVEINVYISKILDNQRQRKRDNQWMGFLKAHVGITLESAHFCIARERLDLRRSDTNTVFEISLRRCRKACILEFGNKKCCFFWLVRLMTRREVMRTGSSDLTRLFIFKGLQVARYRVRQQNIGCLTHGVRSTQWPRCVARESVKL